MGPFLCLIIQLRLNLFKSGVVLPLLETFAWGSDALIDP